MTPTTLTKDLAELLETVSTNSYENGAKSMKIYITKLFIHLGMKEQAKIIINLPTSRSEIDMEPSN